MTEREAANKMIAKMVHTAIKIDHPEAKLADAYEYLSKRAGYQSWNHASAAGVDFRITYAKIIDESKKSTLA